MSQRVRIPKFILLFFLIEISLVFLYLLDWKLGQPIDKLTFWLDLDGEKNIPSWYSSIQYFLVACLWAIFASAFFDKNDKKSWFLPIIILVFIILSLDEIIGIHEWVVLKIVIFVASGSFIGGDFKEGVIFTANDGPVSILVIGTVFLFFIGIPFILIMIVMIKGLKQYVKGRPYVIRRYSIGVIMLVISAVGFDIVSFILKTETYFILAQCFEELGEMIAVTFFLWAIYDLLISYNFSLRRGFNSTTGK